MESCQNKTTLPSERKFGFLFTFVFVLVSGYLFYNNIFNKFAFFFSFLAVLFLLIAIFKPSLLKLFNRLWFEFGIILGKIINPVVLGLLFFFLIAPVAIITRISGRDTLRLKLKKVDSYWQERQPEGPSKDSFKNQY